MEERKGKQKQDVGPVDRDVIVALATRASVDAVHDANRRSSP